MLTESWVLHMDDTTMRKFPVGDHGELFDTALKHSYIASWRTPINIEIFEAYVFVKFTKILSHENLEPYGVIW